MTAIDKATLLVDGPKRKPRATIVLAHGAGAPMDSDFMNTIAMGLTENKFRVVRFEFPYMQEKRKTGKNKPPNSQKILIEYWNQVIESLKSDQLFIGGKSMGGRIASMVADQNSVSGLICLGYPFHPPGKPEKLRTEHLETMQTKTLILQGERDTFGSKSEVENYQLSKKIKLAWLEDGDHSFKPRKKSGVTVEENLDQAVAQATKFIEQCGC